MGVMCKIFLNESKHGVYKAGQRVSGKVQYAVDQPTEYKDIVLSLVGQGRCRWSESRSDDSADDVYEGTEEYISRHINVLQKKPNEIVTIPFGCYEYPFEFILPKDLPSSYNDLYCTINYYIKVKFVRPGFLNLDKKFKTEFYVYGSVDAPVKTPVIYDLDKTITKFFSNKRYVINLMVTIQKNLLTPGENVQLDFVVKNDSDIVIKGIRVEIICTSTYTANNGRKKTSKKTIKGSTVETVSLKENSVVKFPCTISTLPELYSIQHTKIFSKEYKLNLTMRLPMPHINASLEIPIAIGETPGDIEMGVEVLEESPPSYWQAMTEEKSEGKNEGVLK